LAQIHEKRWATARKLLDGIRPQFKKAVALSTQADGLPSNGLAGLFYENCPTPSSCTPTGPCERANKNPRDERLHQRKRRQAVGLG
jgi:hypothetical protein